MTTIDFGSLSPASSAQTPQIPAGGSQLITFEAPAACLTVGCAYKVTVNSDNTVTESRTDNNQIAFDIIGSSPPTVDVSSAPDCTTTSPIQAPSPPPSCTSLG